MAWDEEDDSTTFKVVINHEEQYSIWPAATSSPQGWKDVGKKGTKKQCFAYIEEVWTDMRPLNLRRKMAEMEARIKRDARG
jgi:MbtH protein